MTQLLHPRYVHSFWDSLHLHNSFLVLCVVLVIGAILFQVRRLVRQCGRAQSTLPTTINRHYHNSSVGPDDDDWTPILRHSASSASLGLHDVESGAGVAPVSGRRKLPHSATVAWFDRVAAPSLLDLSSRRS
jgi:hypothetical protein